MAQDTAAKKRSECEHLKHLLDNERKLHEKSQEDVKGLQAENKDLILQTANARALACSVEELKGQLTKVQVCRLQHPCSGRNFAPQICLKSRPLLEHHENATCRPKETQWTRV